VKTPSEISAGFNEMVALRDIPGGLEIELFKSITPAQLNDAKFTIKQWTYIPTKGYGGRNFGTEILPLFPSANSVRMGNGSSSRSQGFATIHLPM